MVIMTTWFARFVAKMYLLLQEKAVQNGRQLALKISANSVYGFTGATVGQLPCIPIASSVTSYGRDLLFQTKSFVENNYTIEKGFPAQAEVGG